MVANSTEPRKWCERLPVGAHFICCKFIERRKKSRSEFEVHYELCCPQVVLGDEIGQYLDNKSRRGGWVYKRGSPYCKQWNTYSGECGANSLSIKTRMETPIPLREVTEMLEAALLVQTQTQQTDQLEQILEELNPPSSEEHEALKQKTLFELLGREVENHILRGVTKLESNCAPTWVCLSSRIVEFRQQSKQRLDQVFDEIGDEVNSASNTTERLDHGIAKIAQAFQGRAQKLRWVYSQNAWTARMILRRYDVGFSESKNPRKEREYRRSEKVPLLIYHILDELVPTMGAGVIFIYAALQEQHHYFTRVRRDIQDIPGFAKFVAKRIKAIDVSNLSEKIAVQLSLAVVGWALGISFLELCRLFGLYNLMYLLPNYEKFDHNEEGFLAAKKRSVTEADREVADLELDRGLYLSVEELQKNVVDALGDYASRSTELTDSGCEREAADHPVRTASPPGVPSFEIPTAFLRTSMDAETGLGSADRGQNGSEHLVPENDFTGQSTECMRETAAAVPDEDSLFLPFQPSIYSGHASNVDIQQVYGTTPVAPSSGTAFSNAKGDRETLRTAGGRKRPCFGDSAASKRRRPSATENSNADLAPTAQTASRDDTMPETLGGNADPQTQSLMDSLPQSEFSSEYWEAVLDGISATFGMADGIPATCGMEQTNMTISDKFQDVDLSETAATLPSFLSEPQPDGMVPLAEER